MNNEQGSYPINESLFDKESKITPAFFVEQRMSEIIEQKFHFDGNALAKTILLICKNCDGPITPLASCLVCRRISYRKCTRCGAQVSFGSHQSCEYLAFLGKERAKKNDKMKKEDTI